MAFYIAADGGGTKTLFRLINGEKNTVASLRAPGTNPVHIGVDRAVKTIEESINQLIASAGLKQEDICRAALFIPVLWRKKDVFDGRFPFPVELLSDTTAAVWAALGQEDGIVVLSGTGSFASGRYNGRSLFVGGWGPYIGDEGSGFAIGRAALCHAARQYDSSALEDELTRLLKSSLGIRTIDELKVLQADSTFLSPSRIASLCPLVEEAAEHGSQAALKILNHAACELGELAHTCLHRLSVPEHQPVKLSVTGGAAVNNKLFLASCIKTLENRFPSAHVFSSARAPIEGAEDYVLKTTRKESIKGEL